MAQLSLMDFLLSDIIKCPRLTYIFLASAIKSAIFPSSLVLFHEKWQLGPTIEVRGMLKTAGLVANYSYTIFKIKC